MWFSSRDQRACDPGANGLPLLFRLSVSRSFRIVSRTQSLKLVISTSTVGERKIFFGEQKAKAKKGASLELGASPSVIDDVDVDGNEYSILGVVTRSFCFWWSSFRLFVLASLQLK